MSPNSVRRKSSRKTRYSKYLHGRRLFGLLSIVVLSVVPLYAVIVLVHRVVGGFEWPMLSPYFWALWFVIAISITIARAPTEDLHDDPFAKTGFALGAINVVTAFVAIFFSAA